jgi:hypothetical protein
VPTVTFQQLPEATALISIVASGAVVANNANSAESAAQRNDPADAAWKGAHRGRFRFVGTFSGTPTVPSAIVVYCNRGNHNGTTYGTTFGTSVAPPLSALVTTIPLTANGTGVWDSPEVMLPAGYHKYLIRLDGPGVQINSAWSLTCLIVQDQGVSP